ncbi:hypothetical protein B9Z19DRAFT_1122755 [Tuber borchii]|uniref:Uncharacterized protein n=1 Tax=Tuber borchii TaxID=42251 RepID=A0A2T6ZZS4_TUBBO|nr:hypothetical protein B9Z19DRAFT_1122755 [Tuber borchii]
MINDLLEAHTKNIEDPRPTLTDVFALSAELDETLELLYDEMHDTAETLETRGGALVSRFVESVMIIE